MNPASKSSFPAVHDPVVASVMEQLKEQVEAKDRVIAKKDQALAAAEAIIQQLKEALRLERIKKYGKQSEKLSDLQLELLDLEPAVASDEIETEAASGPLPEDEQNAPLAAQQQQKKRKPHPGRSELARTSGTRRRDRRQRGLAVHVRQVRRRDPRDRLRRD